MNTQQISTNTTFIENSMQMAKAYSQAQADDWLQDYRQLQIELFENTIFPNKRVEHFKYNRLHAFDDCDFADYDTQCTVADPAQIKIADYAIESLTLDSKVARVVFIDGQLQVAQSDFKAHKITAFSDTNEQQKQSIIESLNVNDVSHNPFILLNACLTNNGLLIEIDEDSPKNLIEIVQIVTAKASNKTLANQVIINVSDSCKANIITRIISASKTQQTALSTNRVIVNVGESSTFNHYHMPLENAHSIHFGSVYYNIKSHAKLNAFHAITGGNIKKVDVEIKHIGQHALAKLNGVYVASDNEQVDCHTTVTHPLPNGTTDEVFRGIVNGKAEAVFNGRIHILEDAQKTLAKLSNKNLLLSDECVLHTKPELEIYADDVICAHGATVSRLQDSALSYLRARGISKAEAEMMLSYAFVDELIQELEITAIADYIRPILFESFK